MVNPRVIVKGKGKTYTACTADAWYCEEEDYIEEDQDQAEDYNEASYQAFEDEAAPGYLQDPESYEDYELCESEAIALNCLEELEESSEAGHAVQLQLAAHAAFGKAKGKRQRQVQERQGEGKGQGSTQSLDPRAAQR